LKDFLESKGFVDIRSSHDTTRIAFREEYIENGMDDMIESRNKSSHTYDTDTA
jgi:hypothetical protein